jgi:hypothetical protein
MRALRGLRKRGIAVVMVDASERLEELDGIEFAKAWRAAIQLRGTEAEMDAALAEMHEWFATHPAPAWYSWRYVAVRLRRLRPKQSRYEPWQR